MANINNYINDTDINDADKLLGSDGSVGQDFGRTKNLLVGDLKDFIKTATLAEVSAIDDKNYVHNQASSSNIWTVTHNLNKNPSVTVVDSAGTVVIGEVEYLSVDQVRITFQSQFSGKAYFN